MNRLYSLLVLMLAISTLTAQVSVDVITELPSAIKETSGLIYFDGRLVTHNDSGNAPELYEIDPMDGAILRTVTLLNANNIDWEDISHDAEYVYVGDFGNNNGDRNDLKIYRISKVDFLSTDSVVPEEIRFLYEDQTDFTSNPQTNWDAEAMISYQGDLIVFTKEWQNMGTTAYRIPSLPGTYTASRLDDYQINGLVTGATFDVDSNQIVLVGYSQVLTPFVLQIGNPQSNTLFSGEINRFDLTLGISQIEGVTYSGTGFFMCSEEFTRNMPSIFSASRLYQFTFETDSPTEPEPEPEPTPEPDPPDNGDMDDGLMLYQPTGSFILNYNLVTQDDVFGYAIFDTGGKRVMVNASDSEKIGTIDTSFLRPSVYFVSFYLRNGRIAKPFIIK